MLELHLLWTPVLALGVLALVRFVGCQLAFPAKVGELPAPESLTATPGNQQVELSWSEVDDEDLTGYEVRKGLASGGPYDTKIASPGTATTFTDTGLANGTTLFYVVAALAGDVAGKPSPEAKATPAQAFVVTKTLGTIRNDFTGVVGMVIQVSSNPLTVFGLGRIFVPGNSRTHLLKIADATTGIDLPGAAATVDLAAGGTDNGFVYEIFPGPVVLNPNTEYYVLSQETLGGDQWYDLDTTVVTANVATVTSAVFSDGVGGPFTRGGGAGHTYGPVDLLF